MRKAKVLAFENLKEENISRRREQSTMLTDIDRLNKLRVENSQKTNI